MSLHICEICKGNTIFSEVEGEKKKKEIKGKKKNIQVCALKKTEIKGLAKIPLGEGS